MSVMRPLSSPLRRGFANFVAYFEKVFVYFGRELLHNLDVAEHDQRTGPAAASNLLANARFGWPREDRTRRAACSLELASRAQNFE